MHAAIEGASTFVFACKVTLEAGGTAVVEAVARRAVAAAHGLGMLTTVASCFHLHRAWLAAAWMTDVLTRVNAAVELLAASVSARCAALVERRKAGLLCRGLRASHRDGLGTAEALLRDGDGAGWAWTWVAGIRAAVGAFASATSLTAAVWVGTPASRWVLSAATPAPVDLGHVFPRILASWTSPCSASVADLGIFLHGIVFFGLLDAALGPLADAWQVQHRVALGARPRCLTCSYGAVADDAVVFARGKLGEQARAQIGIFDWLSRGCHLDHRLLRSTILQWL